MNAMYQQQTPEVELQARKLEPGTWVIIRWNDAEPTAALFLRYTGGSRSDGNYRSDYTGDRSIECFYPSDGKRAADKHSRATHTQVIAIHHTLDVPNFWSKRTV